MGDGQFVVRLGPVGTVDENVFSPEDNAKLEELFKMWPSWDSFDKATQWAKQH